MASHYEALGVAEDATPDQIKQAYRKLAMQWHPDRHKGDKAAEAKFKEINEAYETVSDSDKRRIYDQQQSGGGFHSGFQGGVPPGFGGFGGPMDDILNQMFNQTGFQFRTGRPGNRDISMGMNVSLEDIYHGKQVPLQFSTPSGKRVELVINIPAGIESGIKIRYQGQGDQSNPSLPPGDLYILINVVEHPLFKRSGHDLESLIKVDAITAMIGGKVKTSCIDGTTVDVTVPGGTQPFTKLRVSGKGMPLHPGYKDHGDLLLIVDIKIPSNLTKGQIDELKKIQNQRGLDNI